MLVEHRIQERRPASPSETQPPEPIPDVPKPEARRVLEEKLAVHLALDRPGFDIDAEVIVAHVIGANLAGPPRREEHTPKLLKPVPKGALLAARHRFRRHPTPECVVDQPRVECDR
ncbi:hypothetical protein GGP52_003099 [Salinibacter ruber]|nr:hypothetical protein [Salinibacter ruber]